MLLVYNCNYERGDCMSDLGNKDVMAENILYYMTVHDLDRNDICKILDIPYTTLSDWLNAKKYPRIDKIEMLANYFGIEKSDLIERRDKKCQDKFQMLFDKTKDILSDDDRAMIEFVMNKRIQEYERSKSQEE